MSLICGFLQGTYGTSLIRVFSGVCLWIWAFSVSTLITIVLFLECILCSFLPFYVVMPLLSIETFLNKVQQSRYNFLLLLSYCFALIFLFFNFLLIGFWYVKHLLFLFLNFDRNYHFSTMTTCVHGINTNFLNHYIADA